MAGRPPVHAGVQLAEQGWDQGSFLRLPLAQMSYLRVEDTSGNWIRQEKALGDDDCLVVVSQVCDIVKKPESEPFVETARAFWTMDKGLIRNAKTNSIRHFCLQRRRNDQGLEEGLIVDGTFRVFISKESLLALAPSAGFTADDSHGPVRFRRWLGARYSRQPIPDHLVRAVQRPIVEALEKLPPNHPYWSVLDGIGEIIYFADDSQEPYRIEMLFIRDEHNDAPPVDQTDVDRLAGWIAGQLDKVGEATLDSQQLTDLRSISAYDYASSYQLPLDAYSLPES